MRRDIPLSDVRYFNLFIGKRILKEEIFNSQGTIPIYSGSVSIPFGFSDKSNIDDFEHDYVIWGIDDAVFDFAIIPKGTKFAITDHCGAIKILVNDILSEYLLYVLKLKKQSLGFGWTLRASLTNMRKVVVDIPVKGDGSFDFIEQTRLVSKWREVKKVISKIKVMYENLENADLEVDINLESVIQHSVNEIFDLSAKTNNSKFTKAYVNRNKGEIPVYSASKDANSVTYGYVKDKLHGIKYFENCLTWNIDGSVGKAFFRKGRFSLSEKVIPLILRPEYKECVNPEYVKILLEQKALEYGFHYSHKAGKGKIKDILISFPSISQGNRRIPDLAKQKEIAQKYKNARAIKKIVQGQLNEAIKNGSLVSVD